MATTGTAQKLVFVGVGGDGTNGGGGENNRRRPGGGGGAATTRAVSVMGGGSGGRVGSAGSTAATAGMTLGPPMPAASASAAASAGISFALVRGTSTIDGGSGGGGGAASVFRRRSLSRSMSAAPRQEELKPVTMEDILSVVGFLARDGRTVTKEDLRAGMEAYFPALPAKALKPLLAGKEEVTKEVLYAMLVRKKCPEEYMAESMQLFDLDETGVISDASLKQLLRRINRYGLPEKGDVAAIYKRFDRDGDGKIGPMDYRRMNARSPGGGGGAAAVTGTTASWTKRHERVHNAATTIARAWRSYFRKKVFRALKTNLYKAERAMTVEIFKRLAPSEAPFISDLVAQPRVRFRFGGTTFPPSMFYKIFSGGQKVQYISGRRVIQPGSQAAADACKVMGARLYTELVISHDTLPDEVDVTNRMEHVQYMNCIDELPARYGGRNNGWRILSFDAFQGHDIAFEKRPAIARSRTKKKSRRRHSRPRAGGGGGAAAAAAAAVAVSTTTTTRGRQHLHLFAARGGVVVGNDGDNNKDGDEGVDVDDEFGELFEWANNLNANDFRDFFEVKL
ncbi:hypothetical protein DFJ73DRAFT_796774 [Zopfochytrium polystomum]|nr:hypothetical protein DFJ73DRAFT_796774 [Zopfochytrium polystomum]